MNYFEEGVKAMELLYGKEVTLSLATVFDKKSNIRVVDTFFYGDAFYVSTYRLSKKCREIAINPHVALHQDFFVAYGMGYDIGSPLDSKNEQLRERFKNTFKTWYDIHVNEEDSNTCYVEIKLEDAIVFNDNMKYVLNFKDKTGTRSEFITDAIYENVDELRREYIEDMMYEKIET